MTKSYGDSAFYLNPRSDSPGEITYSVLSGSAATVTPQGYVTIIGVGTVVLQVTQEASPPYDAVTYNTLLTIQGVVTDFKSTTSFVEVAVYPNPTRDVLYIQKNARQNCDFASQLFDMRGEAVFGTSFKSDNSDEVAIDMSGLTPGIYMLRLTYCDQVLHRRIVRQ